MKKEKLKCITLYMIVIFFVSVVLNHTWMFLFMASLGVGLMFAVSYIDYRKFRGKYMHIWAITLAGLIFLNLCGLNGVFGVIVISLTVICACLCG